MRYHCRFCGGFLKFTEEKAMDKGRGRYFICKCNKCDYVCKQYSTVYCVKAKVISNEKILDYRIIKEQVA